jgi:sec-independent protein translocase protein TatB
VLGINGLELVVLAIIAVVVLGPERLPEYAAQLARLVRGLRRMATGAREQLREEVGPELDEVDWRKLDPRQYDPRRIIKEALLDDIEDVFKPVSPNAPKPAVAAPAAAAVAVSRPSVQVPIGPRLEAGDPAPYDREAT